MTIPYHLFQGTCADASHAYAAIFRSPAPQAAQAGGPPCGHSRNNDRSSLLYAAVRTGRCWRTVPNLSEAEPKAGSSVAVTMSDAAEGKRVFDALAEGGQVERAYEPTAWSPGFGCLTDRWGTHWMVDALPPPKGGA